jgi:hypothetical protein
MCLLEWGRQQKASHKKYLTKGLAIFRKAGKIHHQEALVVEN